MRSRGNPCEIIWSIGQRCSTPAPCAASTKTRLELARKSQGEIAQAIATALDKNELPALEPGAMTYMMSKQQYLNDRDKTWRPHVMFYSPGDNTWHWSPSYLKWVSRGSTRGWPKELK